MAHIRTFAELEALPPTKAEWQMINAAKTGELCTLGDGSLPPEGQPDPTRGIRAEVLRYLILGGCTDFIVDEIGVWLRGAGITGTLDLSFTSTRGAIRILNTRFDSPLLMTQTKCQKIDLKGSHLLGWNAIAVEVVGSVNCFYAHSKSTINLSSAKIGGQLGLIGAQLASSEGDALTVQGAQITGGIFLHPTVLHQQEQTKAKFNAKGSINLIASTIGGLYGEWITLTANAGEDALRATNLTVNGIVSLDHCSVAGTVNLTGAMISGDLICRNSTFNNEGGDAFVARRMRVAQSFIWRKDASAKGSVILDGAHVAELDDNPSSWPNEAQISLDGFTYERIADYTSYDAARKRWLHDGSLVNGKFFPQPYTQYAKFLRETGHDTQARKVLLTREIELRKYERKELSALTRLWRGFWDPLQWIVVGYGHAPFRSTVWLFALWITAVCLSHKAWDAGDFAPTSAVIQASDAWTSVAQGDTLNPAEAWSVRQTLNDGSRTYVAGQDWSTFNSFAYAADLVIPIINLGQTDTWGPSTERGDWGRRLWRYGFFLQIAGWIVTALGAAAITGIIRRD